MEDILAVYTRALDEKRPLICFDETNRQLLDHLVEPLPMRRARPRREDSEFCAGPKVNLFMIFAPLLGWRRVKVTERRCAVDFAEVIREIVDEDFPHAQKIVLVMDNLNTHSASSLYARYPAAEARRIYERLEIHHTPRHGSWLNMAEIELSVLARQCLKRRIATDERMKEEVSQWCLARNTTHARANWRFTTEDARIKLRKLYPTI